MSPRLLVHQFVDARGVVRADVVVVEVEPLVHQGTPYAHQPSLLEDAVHLDQEVPQLMGIEVLDEVRAVNIIELLIVYGEGHCCVVVDCIEVCF